MKHFALPKITVIVAVYNGVETLPQCLESVVQQDYPHVELIVIDGGSQDGTVDLIRTHQDKISYWLSESDRGIYNAWNKALAQATGEWMCFLGADDFFWNKDVLARMSTALQAISSEVRVAYGQIMLLNQKGQSLYPIGEPWPKVKDRFNQLMSIPHPAVMHRSSLFKMRGTFDESFRIAGDYELLLRELKYSDAVFVPDLILTGMRQGGVSSDPMNSINALLETRRAQRMHGKRFPGWIWLSALVRVYVRLIIWRVMGEKVARRVLDAGRRVMGRQPYWTQT